MRRPGWLTCFGGPTGHASMVDASCQVPSLPCSTNCRAWAWNETRSYPRCVEPSGEKRRRTGSHHRGCSDCPGPNAFSLPWANIAPPVLAHHERNPGGCVVLEPSRAASLARAHPSCTDCRRLAVHTHSPRVLVGLAWAVATAAPHHTSVCRLRRNRPQENADQRAIGTLG